MPAACPCNHMFTAGINRNHNNRTSLPPCVNCLLLVSLSLRDGMSVRIIPSHDILSCLYSIMSNFSFNGLRIRISADRSCNRMFTVGISRNHDNCTSLPPSLIVCYSCCSLQDGMSAGSSRIVISGHRYLLLLNPTLPLGGFCFLGKMSAMRISLNHDTSPYIIILLVIGV